jgi:hypothetical protein
MAKYDIIRFRYRFSIKVDQYKVELTFIKNSKTENIDAIKTIRDQIFVPFAFTKEWFDAMTQMCIVELEWEYDAIQKWEVVQKHIDLVFGTPVSQFVSLNTVYRCLQTTVSNPTLKKILPAAVELNKRQYVEEVAPFIDNFFVTEKADGIRVLLFIDLDADVPIHYYDNEFHEVKSNINITDMSSCRHRYIFEAEMIGEHFYVYDAILTKNKMIADRPLWKRLNRIQNCTILDQFDNISVKKFHRLGKDYSDVIRKVYAADYEYNIDGLIFSSADHPYRQTKFYKWKPMEHTTIDFVAMKCPSFLHGIAPYHVKPDKTLYLLFVGVQKHMFQKLNMKKLKYYDQLFPYIRHDYFPIQFSPSDKPNAYIWYHSDPNLHHKIVELTFDKDLVGHLKRVREDRAKDLANAEYFGNNFRIAEIIWRNFVNPLTLDYICSDMEEMKTDFYFRSSSDLYLGIRKFNNSVKRQIIQSFNLRGCNVIDLGCGRGQDIHKLISADVRNVLMIDSVQMNLCELIYRKYSYCADRRINGRIGVYVQCLDLTRPYVETLTQIHDSGIPLIVANTRLVICNFAIHYLIGSPDKVTNLVNLVYNMLPVGGRFMCTYMDGHRVYDLVNKTGEWKKTTESVEHDTTKYHVMLVPSTTKPTKKIQGLEIDVLLPFSNGMYYREPLVDIEMLTKKFKQKKMVLESLTHFTDYNHSELPQCDLEYIKLLDCAVFLKV